jgi:hypothetical protein
MSSHFSFRPEGRRIVAILTFSSLDLSMTGTVIVVSVRLCSLEDSFDERMPGVLPRLLQELHAAGVLTEDLALPEDPEDLEATYRGLCHLPDVKGCKRRRIDFLSVPWSARGAALLYYTVRYFPPRPRIITEIFSG